MTQYQRITGKVFGGNATATGNDPQIAQFGSALANTFVGTTDPETIQSLPAWGQGWIGAVTPETQFPPLPEMTGAMKVLSHQICGILQQGVSTWDSGTIYYTGNFVSLNGRLYISQVDENQGNNPAIDTTNWQEFSSVNPNVIDGQFVDSYRLLTDSTTTVTIDLSDYLPNDGYDYLVLFSSKMNAHNSSVVGKYLKTDIMSQEIGVNFNSTYAYYSIDSVWLPVGNGRTITSRFTASPSENAHLYAYGYRRMGTNQ